MTSPMRKFVWGSSVALACLLAAPAGAQETASVILIDRNVLEMSAMPPTEINATIADVGVRDALAFFNVREGRRVELPFGMPGHEGWFTFNAVPSGWSTPGTADGLENFVFAGPGLGSPDAGGNRASLLGSRAEVKPMDFTRLTALVDRPVCVVAYRDELPQTTAGVNLSGANLGLLAFAITGTSGGDGQSMPSVEVTVLETRTVCGSALAPAGQ